MKARHRTFRRGGVYYAHDGDTRKQRSLGTRDKTEAARLLAALNESSHAQSFNLQLARVYLTASNPRMAERTWGDVFGEVMALKTGVTRDRWENAIKDAAYRGLLPRKLIETTAEDFLKALNSGTVSTNVFLRRVHNFALDMNWLLSPVIVEQEGRYVARLFQGSGYDGSRDGAPGLGHQIRKLTRAVDEDGNLAAESAHPERGVLIGVEKTTSKGSKYPKYRTLFFPLVREFWIHWQLHIPKCARTTSFS